MQRKTRFTRASPRTVEPPILELETVKLLEGDKPWKADRLPLVEDRVRARLNQLMVSVLLRLRPSGLLNEFPSLAAYVARGEARPAYQQAFAAQLAINAAR